MERDKYYQLQDAVEAAEKKALAREYESLIGYDPFKDDPSITVAEVVRILMEHKAERCAS